MLSLSAIIPITMALIYIFAHDLDDRDSIEGLYITWMMVMTTCTIFYFKSAQLITKTSSPG